jgi:hypothetical protein
LPNVAQGAILRNNHGASAQKRPPRNYLESMHPMTDERLIKQAKHLTNQAERMEL